MNSSSQADLGDQPIGPEVSLHIDELVLEGFPVADRHRIAAMLSETLQRELARSPHSHAWPHRASSLDAIDGGSITIAAGAKPDQVGAQLAHLVFHALPFPAAEPGDMAVAPRASSAGIFGPPTPSA